MVDSYHMVDTESLCSSASEPHIWMMVLYYSSVVVNIRRLRVAVATVTLTRNLISVPWHMSAFLALNLICLSVYANQRALCTFWLLKPNN